VRDLRQSRPDLRILMLSASTDQETVLEALRLGACDYLAKPLHDEELTLAVGRAADVYRLERDSTRLRDRLSRLVALAEDLSRTAASAEGPEREASLSQGAADAAAELMRADKTSLMSVSDAGDELRVVASVGRDVTPQEMDAVPIGQAVAGIVFERDEALLVQSGTPEHLATDRAHGRYHSDSFMVAPLAAQNQSFGVLCAADAADGGDFEVEDLTLLRLLAGRVAELFASGREAKRLDEAPIVDALRGPLDALVAPLSEIEAGAPTEEVDRDAAIVRQICDALVNHVEPERVLRGALEPIHRELAAVPVSLYLLDPSQARLRCEVQLDGGVQGDRIELPASRGLTGTVLHGGHLVATPSPELDPRFDPEVDTASDGRPRPLLCLPLRMRGQIVGLCRVFLPVGEVPSARTGEMLATALSAAVRNVLLYRSLVESIEEVAEARRQARA
jgi:transcriptional regulator with GAF, ATPase, and Fis domain